MQKGCDRTQIASVEQCPPIGTKGNNFNSQQDVSIVRNPDEKWTHADSLPSNPEFKDPDVTIKNAQPLADSISPHTQNGGVGYAVGLLLPCIFVMCSVLWIFYAYRNPHTKSGQLLIQVS